jgi:hypothetical protein
MSEYRNPEDAENMNDIPFSEPEKPVRKTVNKKQNKGANGIAVIAASAVISTMCGLGGGWFAYTHLGSVFLCLTKIGIEKHLL